MPDGSINVKITAEASGFVAGVNQAGTATKQLEVNQQQMRAALAQTNGDLQKALLLLEGQAAAAQQAATANAALANAAQQAGTANNGLAQSAATAAQSTRQLSEAEQEFHAAVQRAQSDSASFDESTASINRAREAFESGAESAHKLSFGSSAVTREFIVMGHEAMQGRFSRIPGSLVVMLEYSNALHAALEKLTPMWALAGVAGVGALGAIGYAAYQAIEGVLALRDATNRLVEAGTPYAKARPQSEQLINLGTSEFKESRGAVREIIDELDKLPASALQSREAFFRLAEGIRGFHPEEHLTDIAKELASAGRTPEGLANAMTERFGTLTVDGETLERHTARLKAAGDAEKAYADALRVGLQAAIQGTEARKQVVDWEQYILGRNTRQGLFSYGFPNPLDMFRGNSPLNPLQMFERPPERPKPVGKQPAPPPELLEITRANEVAEKRTPEDKTRNDLQAEYNKLLAGEAALRSQITELTAAGQTTPRSQELTTELERNLAAQANVAAEMSRVHSAGEAKAHGETMARLSGELEAERNNAGEVVAIRAAQYDEVLRYQAEAIAKAQGISLTEAGPEAAQTREALDAQNQFQSAVRGLRDQEFKTWIDQMREAEAQAGKSGQQRIAIEEQVNAAIHAAAAEPEPRVNAAAVEAADKRLADVKRQAAAEASQAVIAGLDEELRAAAHNADARIAIEQRKYEEIRRLAMQPLLDQGMGQDAAGQLAAQQPQVIAALNAVTDATRSAEREKLDIRIEAERAAVAETTRGSQERVAVERNILGELQDIRNREGQQSIVSDREIEAQKLRLNASLREQNNERFQEFKAEQLLEVENTNATVDQIIAAYARIKREAQITGQSPVVLKRLDVEQQGRVQRGEHQQFTNAQSDVRSAEEDARLRISINKSQHDIEVAQHRESKSQAAAKEQEYTEQLLGQIAERTQAEELANAKTPEDTKKALQDSAKAWDEYGAKVLEGQAKISAAVEAENKKQVEAIKQGFDQIGSAFEGAFKGLIDGSTQANTRVVQTMHVAANGVVFFTNTMHRQSALAVAGLKLLQQTGDAVANTLLKVGTQKAAEWLGQATGHPFRDDETPSLSGLLGNIVGDWLGLTKKAPDKQEALNKAGGALSKAAADLSEAAQILAGKGVVGTGAAGTGGQSPSATAAEHSGAATVSGAAPGSTAEMTAYMQQKHGYDAPHAASVIGQLTQESSLNPLAGLGTAHQGLAQWDATRFAALKKYAEDTGKNWKDWQTQLDFANQEIHAMTPEFFSAQGISAQTDILTGGWEKPAKRGTANYDWETTRRTALADRALPIAQAQSGTPGTQVAGATPAPQPAAATGTSTMPIAASPDLYAPGTAVGNANQHFGPGATGFQPTTPPATPAVAHENVAPSGGGTGASPTGTAGDQYQGAAGTPSGPSTAAATPPIKTGLIEDLGIVTPARAEERPEFEAEYQRRGAGQAGAPVQVDLEQVAGSALSSPATTSGGGLPVSSAAPPSAEATPAPAVPIPAPEPTLVTGLSAPNASPGGEGFSSQLATLGPMLEANTTNLTTDAAALNTLTQAITNQQASTQTDASTTQSNTTSVQGQTTAATGDTDATKQHQTAVTDNTTAVKALTDKLGSSTGASPGTATPSSDSSSSSGSVLGVVNSLLGLAGPVAKLTGIGAIGTGASAIGGALKAITQLGSVIGFAEGGPVEETGLALVHKGEVVIPADEASQMASASPNAFSQIWSQIAGVFTGSWGRGLFGAPDPNDPDDPRRPSKWATPTQAADNSRYDRWGGDKTVSDPVADSIPDHFTGDVGRGFGLLSSGLDQMPTSIRLASTAADGGGDWSSADDNADVASADNFAPSLELGGVMSAAGGMVVSGGPQTVAPLGWATPGSGTIGSPNTYSDLLNPTPPPVVHPQYLTSTPSKLPAILGALGGGAALLAAIAGLFKKGGSESSVGDGSAQGSDWSGAQWTNTATGGDWQSDSPGGGDWSSALDSGAAGMVIPSAAGGMRVDDGKGGTLAIVHPNEMVLPANLSKGIQGIINSGAGDMGGVPSADAGMVVGSDFSSSSDTTSSSNLNTSLGSLRDSNIKTQAGQTDNTQAINRLTNKLDTSGTAGSASASGNAAGTGSALGGTLTAGGSLIGGPAGQTISGIGKAISTVTGLVTSIPKVASGIGNFFSGGASAAGAAAGGAANSAASLAPVTAAITAGTATQSAAIAAGTASNVAVTTAGTAATTTGSALNQVVTGLTTAATTAGDQEIVTAIALEAAVPKPFGFAAGSWNIPDDMLANIHKGEMIIPADYAERLRSGGGSLGQALGMMVGRNLPHFELGAWEIAHDMGAFLHRGEQVVPANYADGLRAAGGSRGSGDVNLHYSPTVNAPAQPTLESYLHREGQTMLGWINAQMRSGALRPPPG